MPTAPGTGEGIAPGHSHRTAAGRDSGWTPPDLRGFLGPLV